MTALKLFFKQLKTGEFTLILLSLALATSTVSVIALASSAIQSTLNERASHLLAADVQITGSEPIPEKWETLAQDSGLLTAKALQFRSMVFSENHNQLFSIKAVDSAYPLKGEIELADGSTRRAPAPGTLYLPPRFLQQLAIDLGSTLYIGDAELAVTRTLLREPDNLRGGFDFSPTLLMHLDDVPQTGVIQPGSRYRTTLYLAGETADLEQYRQQIADELGQHFSWNTLEQANRNVVDALDKAQSFILLGMVLSVLLSGIAIGLGTRRYALGQVRQTALLKTLGFGPRRIKRIFVTQVHVLAVLGIVPGLLLGRATYAALTHWIGTTIPDLQPAGVQAYTIAVITVYLTLLAFAAPYFWRLYQVSPLAALREQYHNRMLNNRSALLMGFGVLIAISVIFSGKPLLVFYISIALFLCYLSSALFAYLLSTNLYRLLPTTTVALGLGLKNLNRHHQQNVPQIVMFAILFTLLFTLILMRTSLVGQWRTQLPENAPNIFAFNIFGEEKQRLSSFLSGHDLTPPRFYPMVRARVTHLNGTPMDTLLRDAKADINYEREMNVTWTDVMGDDNMTVQGAFWPPNDGELYASLEEQFAEGISARIGDTLTLSVQGEVISPKIVHLRQVQWDSLNPNFFIITNQAFTSPQQANWLTSFHLPEPLLSSFNTWLRDHPTMTIVEIAQTIDHIQQIISQVSLTIEMIGAMVVLAGVLVLIASLQMTLDMRTQEGALLRVFGAPSRVVSQTLAVEYFFVSTIATVMACLASEVAVNLLAWKVFDLKPKLHGHLWLIAPLLIVPSLTWISRRATRDVVIHPPLTILRRMQT